MKYRKVGRTGLMVSEFALGCINFGEAVQEKDAIEIVRRAYELGINHFDTADMYPALGATFGLSEKILGKALKPFRNEVVIVTKVSAPEGEGPNAGGLSRYHLINAVERSLHRLQTDYIDVYLAHQRDPRTPIDETLRAFDDLVHSGKVRYIGCSNYASWEICKALWISDKHNLARFDCVQDRYNLITRSAEREILPFCAGERLGMFVYNPLAGGLLAGGLYEQDGRLVSSYTKGAAPPKAGRFVNPLYQKRYWYDRNLEAVQKLQNIAKSSGHTSAQIALAWLLSNKTVTSVLTCVDFPEQLDLNLSAAEISLSDSEISGCNEIYKSMLPPGWSIQEEGADHTGFGIPTEFAF
ncbi:aldo/keto reductase [Chloroflexota bacterium]